MASGERYDGDQGALSNGIQEGRREERWRQAPESDLRPGIRLWGAQEEGVASRRATGTEGL
jgi:hypothetical protein